MNDAANPDDWTRVLFEAIDDAVFVHDEAGRILEANPAACRRLGYSRDELLALTTRDIDDPDFAQGYADRLDAQRTTGNFHGEGVHRAKDGRRLFVDINTSAITLHGKPAVLAVMRDLTRRKQVEETLNKQTQLLQSILDHMGDAILVADPRGEIFLFNPAAEAIFGPALLQHGYRLMQVDRVTPLDEHPMQRCVRGESFDEVEAFLTHEEAPSGRWVVMTGRPLRDRAGALKGGVLVGHDITPRKRSDRQLQVQYDVARILTREDSAGGTLALLLATLGEAMEFGAGVVWATQPLGRPLHFREAWQRPGLALDAFMERTRRGAPAAGAVDETDAPLDGETPWRDGQRWAAARRAGLQSVLALPVQAGGDTLGVLEFWSLPPSGDLAGDLSLLQAVASQLGQYLQRRRVETALRESQSLYESLLQNLPQNIFRKDRGSRLTFVNQRYADTLGVPIGQLLGKTDFDLFPSDLADKYVRDDQRLMATGQAVDTVEEHHLPDGHVLHVHVVKTPVHDAQGAIVGVQGIFWDVTAEVLGNQAVAQSERRYRQLTEATMDGIVVFDGHGVVTMFNPAAERMFGHRAADIVGQSVALVLPNEFPQAGEVGVTQALEVKLLSFLGRPREFQGRRSDGAVFPAEMVLSVLSESGSSEADSLRVLAAIRDLTERNKMRAVVAQNEKLASIGLLSAGVAHEINNPLAFVANNLVVLERDSKGLLDVLAAFQEALPLLQAADPRLHARIEQIVEETDLAYTQQNLGRLLARTRDGIDRVTRIVHSLRGMARTDSPKKQLVRVPDLVDGSLEILKGRFKKLNVDVQQEHDADPVVWGAPTQLSQVVLNLLVNAFQAIEGAHRADGRVSIRTQRAGDDLLLEVRDNGAGVSAADLPKLFDPFFTTKDVGEGTGLGLAITHNIISAHGGRIEVESEPGRGACFRVHLPRHERRDRP